MSKVNHGGTASDKSGASRQWEQHKLMVAWLKKHRRDVLDVIIEEAAKKFPYVKRTIIHLPDSLAKLK